VTLVSLEVRVTDVSRSRCRYSEETRIYHLSYDEFKDKLHSNKYLELSTHARAAIVETLHLYFSTLTSTMHNSSSLHGSLHGFIKQ
jgi:hypothetical protein